MSGKIAAAFMQVIGGKPLFRQPTGTAETLAGRAQQCNSRLRTVGTHIADLIGSELVMLPNKELDALGRKAMAKGRRDIHVIDLSRANIPLHTVEQAREARRLLTGQTGEKLFRHLLGAHGADFIPDQFKERFSTPTGYGLRNIHTNWLLSSVQHAGEIQLRPAAMETAFALTRIVYQVERDYHAERIRGTDIARADSLILKRLAEVKKFLHDTVAVRTGFDSLRTETPYGQEPYRLSVHSNRTAPELEIFTNLMEQLVQDIWLERVAGSVNGRPEDIQLSESVMDLAENIRKAINEGHEKVASLGNVPNPANYRTVPFALG